MNPLTTVDIPPGDCTNDLRVSPPAPCVACGSHHGAVNAEILCLRRAVVALRAQPTRSGPKGGAP